MRRCTLPYRQRTVRPIAYYINPRCCPRCRTTCAPRRPPATTPSACPPADEVRRGAFTCAAPRGDHRRGTRDHAAIANAREVECRRTGGERRPATRSSSTTARPRRRTAPGSGAPEGHQRPRGGHLPQPRAPRRQHRVPRARLRARLGDVRYNHITFIPGRTRAPFGGIAHWGYDPLTGEVVSNGGMNMGRSVEYAAAQQRDYILLALGELERRRLRQRRRGPALRAQPAQPRGRRAPGHQPGRSRERVRAIDGHAARAGQRAERRPSRAPRRPSTPTSEWCRPPRRAAPRRPAPPRASRPPPRSFATPPGGRHGRRGLARQPRLRPAVAAYPVAFSTRPRPCAAWTPRSPSRAGQPDAAPRSAGLLLPGHGRPPVVGSATFRASPGGFASGTATSRPRARAAHLPRPAHRGLQGHRAARDRPLARALPRARRRATTR
jgi:hypothetical protein